MGKWSGYKKGLAYAMDKFHEKDVVQNAIVTPEGDVHVANLKIVLLCNEKALRTLKQKQGLFLN